MVQKLIRFSWCVLLTLKVKEKKKSMYSTVSHSLLIRNLSFTDKRPLNVLTLQLAQGKLQYLPQARAQRDNN